MGFKKIRKKRLNRFLKLNKMFKILNFFVKFNYWTKKRKNYNS